jgi:hypothetical protein
VVSFLHFGVSIRFSKYDYGPDNVFKVCTVRMRPGSSLPRRKGARLARRCCHLFLPFSCSSEHWSLWSQEALVLIEVKFSAAWIQCRSFEWLFLECKLDFFGGLELRLWLCLKLALSFFPLPPLWVSARTAFVGRRLALVCDLTTRLEECRHCALQAIEYSELVLEVSLRFVCVALTAPSLCAFCLLLGCCGGVIVESCF